MALCKFGHVSLVNKISQKLLKLEPWNLMNRLVAMSRWPDYAPSFEWNWWGILFCLHLSIRLFVRSSSFFCACHILRTLHARVLKFYIWVPNAKIADPYFVSCLACLFKVMPLWKKSELNLVSKISWKVFKLGSWNSIQWAGMMCTLPDYILREFHENIDKVTAVLLILTLSARFLEKHLSWGLEILYADWGWCGDYLVCFLGNSMKNWCSYGPL